MANITSEERKIIKAKKVCGYDLINTTTEKEFNHPDSVIASETYVVHLVAYTGDLDFGVNNEHPDSFEGVVYYFDHWIINCEPFIRFHPCTDIMEDWVDITYLLEYSDDIQVLMRKKDINQYGFRFYLKERIKNTINFLNSCNIVADSNLVIIKAYRDIAALLNFVNKYNINLLEYGKEYYYMIIKSTDNDNNVYQFELIKLPKNIEKTEIPTKEWFNNLRYTGREEEKPETSHPSKEDAHDINPT